MSVPQLPLALRYPPDQRLESFIGAPDGALAQLRAAAVGAAQDWLYLSGPAGTGKTHLALALCAAAEQAGRDRLLREQSAELDSAVKAKGMTEEQALWWRQKFLGVRQ